MATHPWVGAAIPVPWSGGAGAASGLPWHARYQMLDVEFIAELDAAGRSRTRTVWQGGRSVATFADGALSLWGGADASSVPPPVLAHLVRGFAAASYAEDGAGPQDWPELLRHPAAWLADPHAEARWRYFDGEHWTATISDGGDHRIGTVPVEGDRAVLVPVALLDDRPDGRVACPRCGRAGIPMVYGGVWTEKALLAIRAGHAWPGGAFVRLQDADAPTHYCSACGNGFLGPLFDGGDGSSYGAAILIRCAGSAAGIPAEYQWFWRRFGPDLEEIPAPPGHGHRRLDRELRWKDGRPYDVWRVEAPGHHHVVHFDIGAFFNLPG